MSPDVLRLSETIWFDENDGIMILTIDDRVTIHFHLDEILSFRDQLDFAIQQIQDIPEIVIGAFEADGETVHQLMKNPKEEELN